MANNSTSSIILVESQPVSISSGQTISAAISTYGATTISLSIPAAWTTSDVTFIVQPTPTSSFSNAIVSAAGVYKISGVVANDYVCLDPSVFVSINSFKIVTSVVQAADRIVTVQFAPILSS